MKSTFLLAILTVFFISNRSHAQVWDEIAKQLPTPQSEPLTNSYFGYSLDIDGDYAVVGGYGFDNLSGIALVYHYNGIDWEFEAKLEPSSYVAIDRFGYSVAIDGDVIVVGARNYNFMGAAFVYVKPLSGWEDATENAKLTSTDLTNSDNFGVSVDISGEDIVVGADQHDENGNDSGAAYLFSKPGGGWVDMTETAQLTPSDGFLGHYFGRSVSISGDNVVVSSPENGAGVAYVFTKPGVSWSNMSETAKLTSSDASSGDLFGSWVSIDDTTIVSSSPGDDDNGSASGSVYVYTEPISGWANSFETAKLTASDGAADDNFGVSVQVDNNQIIVGANKVDINGSNVGKAYVFEGSANGWTSSTETAQLTALNGVTNDNFGHAVGVSGDHALSGAFLVDDGQLTTGAFYAFKKSGTNWVTETEDQLVFGVIVGAKDYYFGCSVAVQGEYSVVGTSGDSGIPGLLGHGAAYVFQFDGLNWTKIARLTASDADFSDKFGYDVAIDNGTIVIGALNRGKVYVFEKPLGGWTDMTETATLTATDAFSQDYFGVSVAISGDKVVVGSQRQDANGTDSGAAYVYSKTGLNWVDMTETAKLIASDGENEDNFGCAVDIDADFIVVGARRDDINSTDEGSAYVYKKPSGGWVNTSEDAKLTGTNLSGVDYFGCSVGISDSVIVVGAEQQLYNSFGPGYAYVFVRNGQNWTSGIEDAILSASDGEPNDHFGHSVSVDKNRIVIGAEDDDEVNGVAGGVGAVYVFDKPLSGWSDMTESEKIIASDGIDNDQFGYDVSISNNIIVVGADRENELDRNSGAAYLYFDCSPVYSSSNVESCDSLVSPSGNYTWYTAGMYNDTMQTFFGCDSVLTINFTLGSTQSASLSMTSCDSLVSPSGLFTWLTSGTYNDTIQSVSGCDSIMTINVTILNSSAGSEVVATCSEYTVPSGHETYGISGVYQDTIQNSVGCDSIITIDLTILDPTSSTDVQTACNSFTWIDGNTYTQSVDTVIYTLTNAAGCDSIVTLDLTIDFLNITVINSSPELLAVASGVDYKWLDCNDNMSTIPGATNQIFTPSENGSYAVELNDNGCIDTSLCEIVDNAILKSLDVSHAIQIYPNPTTGKVLVNFAKNQHPKKYKIIDPLGSIILADQIEKSDELELTIDNVPGLYFLIIELKNGNQLMKRIVKH